MDSESRTQVGNQFGFQTLCSHNFTHELSIYNQTLRKLILTMALSRFTHTNPFFGFDDFFSPTPVVFRNSLFEDLVPRDDDFNLFRSSPGYQIGEVDGKYRIEVDLPGVKTGDVKVELENDGKVLHIFGGRKVTRGDSVTETRFEKRFTIGEDADIEKMTANLSDGVLTLTAPKKEKVEPAKKFIEITEGPVEEKKVAVEEKKSKK